MTQNSKVCRGFSQINNSKKTNNWITLANRDQIELNVFILK